MTYQVRIELTFTLSHGHVLRLLLNDLAKMNTRQLMRGETCLVLESAVVPLDQHHGAGVVGRVRKREAPVQWARCEQPQPRGACESAQGGTELGFEDAVRVSVRSTALHGIAFESHQAGDAHHGRHMCRLHGLGVMPCCAPISST